MTVGGGGRVTLGALPSFTPGVDIFVGARRTGLRLDLGLGVDPFGRGVIEDRVEVTLRSARAFLRGCGATEDPVRLGICVEVTGALLFARFFTDPDERARAPYVSVAMGPFLGIQGPRVDVDIIGLIGGALTRPRFVVGELGALAEPHAWTAAAVIVIRRR